MRRLALLGLIAVTLPTSGTAAYPGTNGRLLFTQARSAFERSVPPLAYLCASTPAGDGPSKIVADDGNSVESPAVSSDGTRLAYSYAGQLRVAGIDGSSSRLLGQGEAPAWTSDSTRVVYQHLGDLRIVRIDGSQDTQLTSGPTWDALPAVSPDGTSVAFVRGRAAPTGEELVLLSLVDGSERVLLATPLLSGPDWSPDGRRIALAVGPSLVTLSASGGDVRTIVNGAVADPAYSPDGTRIAFERDGDIWTSATDGSDLVNVTRSPPRERQPAWQNGAAPTPAGSDRPCAIVGTDGPDELVGSDYDDIFYDLGGDDVIRGEGGRDAVYDGAGIDRIETGEGDDWIFLRFGANVAHGGPGNDFINGLPGSYQHETASLPQQLYGDDGNDLLTGGSAADRIEGGSGRDVLNGGKGPDVLLGGADADQLAGNRGDDSLQGNQGDDVLFGGLTSGLPLNYDGYDLLDGGEGDDRLAGGWQKDRLFGGPGDDRLAGGRNADYFVGGPGIDTFLGEHGDDLLLARDTRRETVSGGPGFDRARLDPTDRRLGVERAIR